jgi:hypothetical protein
MAVTVDCLAPRNATAEIGRFDQIGTGVDGGAPPFALPLRTGVAGGDYGDAEALGFAIAFEATKDTACIAPTGSGVLQQA